MNSLLVVERIVLESLAKKEKNIEQLMRDTGLGKEIICNILSVFLTNEIICYGKGIYYLNKDKQENWIGPLTSKLTMKEEAKELFISLVNSYFKKERDIQSSLKLQKVWMTDSEKKIFFSLLNSVEIFLADIKKERKKKSLDMKTSEETVIFWGHANYSHLLTEVLESV